MKDKFGTARPYTAAFVILKKDGKIAFVLRGNLPWMPHHYGLPSGKVEVAEPFTLAAIREAKEEAGVNIVPQEMEHVLTMQRYSGEEDCATVEWVDLYFEAKKWDGEPYNAEPHMHEKLEWFTVEELPANTIPPVKAALEAITKGETYAEYGWAN